MSEDDQLGGSGLLSELRQGLKSRAAAPSAKAVEVREATSASRRAPSVPARSSDKARAAADRLLRSAGYVVADPDRPVWSLVDRDGRAHRIGAGLSIGRAVDPDTPTVVVPDDRVSRRHAMLRDEAGRLMVADLGSTNGTWLQRGMVKIEVGSAALVAEDGDLIVTADGCVLATVRSEREPSA